MEHLGYAVLAAFHQGCSVHGKLCKAVAQTLANNCTHSAGNKKRLNAHIQNAASK
jgi:hypothetical protein